MTISLRAATLDDLDVVATLVPRLASRTFSPDYYRIEELVDGTLRALRAALERAAADEFFVLAVEGECGVGFLWANTKIDYFTGEPHGYVEEIAVSTDGAGIGTRLMDAAETWSRARGHRYISLNVRPKNDRAKAMYIRRGYELDVESRLKLL